MQEYKVLLSQHQVLKNKHSEVLEWYSELEKQMAQREKVIDANVEKNDKLISWMWEQKETIENQKKQMDSLNKSLEDSRKF